jgi:hypothetical protein
MHGDAGERGRIAIASMASLPRLWCTMSRVYLPVRAQCTQATAVGAEPGLGEPCHVAARDLLAGLLQQPAPQHGR